MFGFDFILSTNFMFLRPGTMKIQTHDEDERKEGTVEKRVHLN